MMSRRREGKAATMLGRMMMKKAGVEMTRAIVIRSG